MGLEVIGAGFGRTGTESLKEALELLGFGRPCDHMFELLKSTHRVEHLEALDRGEAPDFDALFDGFQPSPLPGPRGCSMRMPEVSLAGTPM